MKCKGLPDCQDSFTYGTREIAMDELHGIFLHLTRRKCSPRFGPSNNSAESAAKYLGQLINMRNTYGSMPHVANVNVSEHPNN